MNLPDCSRGSAWPPSVRTARRSVKSDNERDPHLYLPPGSPDRGTIGRPLALSQRKGRATVGQYAPNAMGYTRNTKDGTMGCYSERNDAIPKPVRSSD